MKPAAAMVAVMLTALPAAAVADPERTWTDFDGAGAAPVVQLPRTGGVAVPERLVVQPVSPAPAAAAPTAVERAVLATQTARPQAPAPARRAAPASTSQSAYAFGMRIDGKASIVDGHTLHVAGHALRLHGVEAPGLTQSCRTRSGTAWPCGARARERLSQLVAGQAVSCVVDEPVGEGAAASCSARGVSDLGRIMVDEGLAVPNGHDRGRYARAAASARESRAGLWAGTFEAPWEFRRKAR